MNIAELVDIAHANSTSKGFWSEGRENIPEKLALIHSEISEALGELRAGANPDDVFYSDNGKPEGFLVELADAVIRIADLAGRVTHPEHFQEVIKKKVEFNRGRPHMHGKVL